MRAKPWIAVDIFTNEVIGNYENEVIAYSINRGRSVIVQYAPRAREVK